MYSNEQYTEFWVWEDAEDRDDDAPNQRRIINPQEKFLSKFATKKHISSTHRCRIPWHTSGFT